MIRVRTIVSKLDIVALGGFEREHLVGLFSDGNCSVPTKEKEEEEEAKEKEQEKNERDETNVQPKPRPRPPGCGMVADGVISTRKE